MNKTEYLVNCNGLMKAKGFFSESSQKFYRQHGGLETVVLNYLHTPSGMLSEGDEVLALVNNVARNDVINKRVKSLEQLEKSGYKAHKVWYIKCIKYWACHQDIINLMK